MSTMLNFTHPWVLLLLPLAALPLIRKRDTLEFSYVPWLPRDRAGHVAGIVWQLAAVFAIAGAVVALAGPGRPETEVERTGYGAEILVLMDRSRSMDDRMLPSDWRSIDPMNRLAHTARGRPKAEVARELISKFVGQRPNDRFSLMFFSTKPLLVVPFTQHDEVVQAAITAAGTGRGLSNTEVGKALIAAAEQFNDRRYTGSRIIMLVSDGGAHLDQNTRERIRAALERNRIALYWMYLRSYNAPTLDEEEGQNEMAPALALHRFFQTLGTPYRVYQADDPEDLARAVADVDRQQNLPLDFMERVPRRDYSDAFLTLALVSCAVLLVSRAMMVRSWA